MATPEEILEAEGSGDGGRTGEPAVDQWRGQEGTHRRSTTRDGGGDVGKAHVVRM